MSFPKGEWVSLFDGKTLTGWVVTDFAATGEVRVEDGKLVLAQGYMTGVTWTNEIPRNNYELSLETMRAEGNDFFCGLTFPVGPDACSFIVGGWGGGVVGLSSLDGQDASENETTKFLKFETGKWYKVRVKMTPAKIEAWLDDEQIVNVETEGKKIDMRPGEIEDSMPFGLATYRTKAAIRNIQIRKF